MAPKKDDPNNKTVAENRKARFSYEVVETYEAGLALTGTEVKSLREGHANIQESYASVEGGDRFQLFAHRGLVPFCSYRAPR